MSKAFQMEGFRDPKSSAVQPPKVILSMVIASILLGVISIAASLFAAGLWGKAYRGSLPQPAQAPSQRPPLDAPNFPPFSGEFVPDGGFAADTRASIIQSLPPALLAGDRAHLLDCLLAEIGAGLVPDQNPKSISAHSTFGTQTELRTPSGFANIKDHSAWFRRIDGSAFLVVFGDVKAPGFDQTTPRYWGALAINRTVSKLRADFPAVTEMQAGFIVNRLRTQFMKNLKQPDDQVKLLIQDVSLQPGNVLSIKAGTTSYFVLPDGRGIDQGTEPLGLDPATGRPLSPDQHPGADAQNPYFPGSYQLMRWLELFCYATIVLAFFLIVSGIISLASPRLGLRLHAGYAVMKLLFIAGEIALSVNYFMSIQPGDRSQIPFDVAAGTRGLIQTVLIQAIYPLVIFAVLRRADVRDFLSRSNPKPAA